MPAFNAGTFIDDAIKSVIGQTFTDWELIIVDDGSTDDTADIASRHASADSRIKIFRRTGNSGNVILPRRQCVRESRGYFLCQLDADDCIATDYLEKLIRRQKSTNADAVLAEMYRWSADGNTIKAVPHSSIDTTQTYAGRNLVKYTLDKWRLGSAGIFRRHIFTDAYLNYPLEAYPMADELLTRICLLKAGTVAFADALYLYRSNPDSTTHSSGNTHLWLLRVNRELLGPIESFYGKTSDEYRLALRQQFHGVIHAMTERTCGHHSKAMKALYDAEIACDIASFDSNGLRAAGTSRIKETIMRLPCPLATRCAIMSAYQWAGKTYRRIVPLPPERR